MKLLPEGLHVKDDLKKTLTVAKFIEWAIGSVVFIVVATFSTWTFLTTHFQTSEAAAADKAQIQSELLAGQRQSNLAQKQLNLALIDTQLSQLRFEQEQKIAEAAKYETIRDSPEVRLTTLQRERLATLKNDLRRLAGQEQRLSDQRIIIEATNIQ